MFEGLAQILAGLAVVVTLIACGVFVCLDDEDDDLP